MTPTPCFSFLFAAEPWTWSFLLSIPRDTNVPLPAPWKLLHSQHSPGLLPLGHFLSSPSSVLNSDSEQGAAQGGSQVLSPETAPCPGCKLLTLLNSSVTQNSAPSTQQLPPVPVHVPVFISLRLWVQTASPHPYPLCSLSSETTALGVSETLASSLIFRT